MNKFAEKLARQLRKKPRQLEPAEDKNPWLTIVLDTYHVFDTGVRLELAAEETRRQAKIACGEGCHACCLRPMVPASEPEILGMWWQITTGLDDENRETIFERLQERKLNAECPFLLQGRCAVYPMRPLACRILHVFGTPCKPEDNIMSDKKGDVWTPSQDVGLKTAMVLLDYFGFKRPKDKVQAFRQGFIPGNSRMLRDVNWEGLIEIYRSDAD